MKLLLIHDDPESSTGDGSYQSQRAILYIFSIPYSENASSLYNQFWNDPAIPMERKKKWRKEVRVKQFAKWLKNNPNCVINNMNDVEEWPIY